MGCCCNRAVRACWRQSYLELDGYGASLQSIGEAGMFGIQLEWFGSLAWGHAHIPVMAKRGTNLEEHDWSGLFDGVFGSSYYATDWCWLQYNPFTKSHGHATPLFLSASDNVSWSITRNGDASGFTNRSWSFLGVHFSDTFGSQSRNHFYVYQFSFTWGGTNYSAVIYIPEAPGRNWDTHGFGETGGYVIFQGVRYSMTDTFHANPPSGAYEHSGVPIGGNMMSFATFFSQVSSTIRWVYPDAGTTTTTVAGTTTTHDIDIWQIDITWSANKLFDFLCHTDKGQVDGLCALAGSYKYRNNCDEAQDYSAAVAAHSSVLIKKQACSAESIAEGELQPLVNHSLYTTPQDTSCVGQDVTTTTPDGCWAWSPPSCQLSCIDRVNEPMWLTPISCKYQVSAHDRTWELFRSGGSSPFSGLTASNRKTRWQRLAGGLQYNTDSAPHAELCVVNRIDGANTAPWLVLKLGVVQTKLFGEYVPSRLRWTLWLAAYGRDLTSDLTVDLIRGQDLSMSRIWQYGESPDYCNDLEITDYRSHQQHNHLSGIGSGFEVFFGGPLEMYHPYSGVSLNIAEWLLQSTTTTSGGSLYTPESYAGEFTLWPSISDVPAPWSCYRSTLFGYSKADYLTSPTYITRPICATIDDGLTPEELYDARPDPGNPEVTVPVTVYEHWIDMPASVVLEAI